MGQPVAVVVIRTKMPPVAIILFCLLFSSIIFDTNDVHSFVLDVVGVRRRPPSRRRPNNNKPPSAGAAPFVRSLLRTRTRTTSTAAGAAASGWRNHVSTNPNVTLAWQEIRDQVDVRLPQEPKSPSSSSSATNDDDQNPQPPAISYLAFLFVGRYHAGTFPDLIATAYTQLAIDHTNVQLLSVVGGGVVGDYQELDEPSKPCLSLLIGPVVADAVKPFYFNTLEQPIDDDSSGSTKALFGSNNDDTGYEHASSSSMLVFADPWSPLEEFLEAATASSSVVAGGISVPTGTGPTVAWNGSAKPQGSLVGVRFGSSSPKRRSSSPSLGLHVVVTQGCRPTGPSYTITHAEPNCILELNGQPAIQVLEDYLNSISDIEERTTVSSGLVCGIAQANTEDGVYEDYLIRQILGFVPSRGGIAVATAGKVGDRFRFHVRDQKAAKDDWRLMTSRVTMERLLQKKDGSSSSSSSSDSTTHASTTTTILPLAAIQISCVARGQSLFAEPNVDVTAIRELLAHMYPGCSSTDSREEDDADHGLPLPPVAGFFANGEIGPVGIAGVSQFSAGEGTFLHGFTTVLAVLCCQEGEGKTVTTSTDAATSSKATTATTSRSGETKTTESSYLGNNSADDELLDDAWG